MKILLGSHHFFPSTGGIETVTGLLAREFITARHQVRVVTQTAGEGRFPFSVVRQPGPIELLRQIRWCDVFVQNNISLRTVWPLLFVRRPLFVIHQTWITHADGSVGWQHWLKKFVLRFATSFAISKAIAEALPFPATRVGNPYDERVFNEFDVGGRTKDLVFVGRLVSDKGADLLLEALVQMELKPRLTIVGDGAERVRLEEQVDQLDLRDRVDFIGGRKSPEIAAILNQHEILVVPSRWAEPFGIVALEGIACGCVVVGSAAGGLAEAIGPCGRTFPNNDAAALARTLDALLNDPEGRTSLRTDASRHLERFTSQNIAKVYLNAMTRAASSSIRDA